MTIQPTISVKSTKEQILQAYQDVLEKLEKKETLPKVVQKQEQDKSIIQKASTFDSSSVLRNIATLKESTLKQIDLLSEEISNKFDVFETLKKSIEMEQNHLKEIYDIQDSAHTLSALIMAQSEEKKKCEDQIIILRQTWKDEKEALERDFKEAKEKAERDRKREDEEYKYKIAMERKKEQDDYAQRKLILEQELSNIQEEIKKREQAITEKEKFYKDLEQKVSEFDKKLEMVVKNAQQTLMAELQLKYDFETKLKEKETEGTINILKEKISTLMEKAEDQEKRIGVLSVKSEMATKQVQEIAVKALEVSSSKRHYDTPYPQREG